METLGPSIESALGKCRVCKHEVINCYKKDEQGNTIRLPENYQPPKDKNGLYLEPVVMGSSCDVISQNYRGIFKDHIFNGCPFFEKK